MWPRCRNPARKFRAAGFNTTGWYAATVPGTVLTTLVNNHVYPEPLYGENDRPEIIPESLVHTSYWYRTLIRVPQVLQRPSRLAQLRRHQLLRRRLGERRAGGHHSRSLHPRHLRHHRAGQAGPRCRGCRARHAAAASRRSARTHAARWRGPERRHHRHRRTHVSLAPSAGIGSTPFAIATPASGKRSFSPPPARCVLKDPLVTTDLPLPQTDSSDVAVQATVENVSDQPVEGVVRGTIENIVVRAAGGARAAQHAANQLRRQEHARAAHGASAALVAQRLRRAESVPAAS